MADSVGSITEALVEDGDDQIKFITGQNFFSEDDNDHDENEIMARFVDYHYNETLQCNPKFESCNSTEVPEKLPEKIQVCTKLVPIIDHFKTKKFIFKTENYCISIAGK